jgi:predicted dehydrogenase
MNAAEAHTMLQTSQRHSNLVAQIVPSPFTFRVDRTIKDLMADGYLGDLYSLVVHGATSEFANSDAPLHWRQRKILSGYNILTMGIWYEGTMRWVGHATRVFAQTRIAIPKRRDPETGIMVDVDVPDHVDIITELRGGTQGSYQFSSVSGLAQGPGAWLFGSKGTLHFDQGSNKLFGGKPGDKELREITIPPEKAGKWRVEEEFANAIRGLEKITHTNFEDGVKYMEFTEAVHRSAESGRAVSLPLLEFNA